jgi:hypothetical protein
MAGYDVGDEDERACVINGVERFGVRLMFF